MKLLALGVVIALAVVVMGGVTMEAQQKQGSTQAQPAKTVVDPVCGMTIDPAKAAGKSEYKGTTYFFCSEHCKKTFDADPEGTLKKAAEKKKP